VDREDLDEDEWKNNHFRILEKDNKKPATFL